MRRSFTWTFLCVLTLIVAPLVTQLVVPAGVARAEPSAPAAVHHDEIVTLTPGGQIVVKDVFPQPGMVAADWNSDTDAGWQYIAAGDFRGDGYEQIVAISGSRLKVFDPFAERAGKTPVTFEQTQPSGWNYQLIATGDFNRDGKDDIAASANYGYSTNLWVYNVLGNPVMHSESFAWPWQAMTTGDFNNDGAADLAMVRNQAGSWPYLKAWNGLDWSTIAERYDSFPWITLEAGKLSSPGSPDQLALLRSGVGVNLDSLIMFTVDPSGFGDLFPGQFKHDPNFTSLALGNLASGSQQLIFVLRYPPGYPSTLLMFNPAGLPVQPFEVSYADLWEQVRTGDLTGDGVSEVVILSTGGLRIFAPPQVIPILPDVPGSYRLPAYGTDWPVMVLANLDGPGIPAGPILTVTPTSLRFNVPWGSPGPQQLLTIGSGGGSSTGWTAEVVQGNSWLRLGASAGTTPGNLYVTVNSVAAGLGAHSGLIKITATDPSTKNSPQFIAVDLTVADPGFVVYPSEAVIWQKIGAPSVTQELQIVRPTARTNWVATALPLSAAADLAEKLADGRAKVTEDGVAIDGMQVAPPSWLIFTPDSGTTPSVMTVRVQTATPGTYRAVIVVAAQDPTLSEAVRTVPVTAVVANQFLYNFLPYVSK